MKTTVNKLRFALLLGFVALSLTAWSQRANIEKMSVSTQMFLDQIEKKADFQEEFNQSKQAGPRHLIAEGSEVTLPFSKPDTINGKVYMSAFVRISSDEVISQLEALGVEIQSQFEGGLMTALIPIENIEEVASLVGVTRINAATPMSILTHKAREATNVDDVLTQSNDAIAAGLKQKYDGSGVILGIIDTGIDFQHIAFKDKSGNTRIKRAYVYDGSSAQEYSSITSSSPTTDDKSEDHGTHTSSTAGGSSVIISGSNVTVTDDHASATYGGMAPGADLYLAGINGLSDTYLTNAVNNMCTYANQQGKPLVVSNSWGSQLGPHDGTGDVADVYNSLFGDSHPNRIALFASSNDAGKGLTGDGGGYHISGTATSNNPLGSILRCHYYSDTDDGYYYTGIIANGWSRAGTTTIKCKVYVLNKTTGAILTSVEVTPTTNGASVSGLSSYYSGSLYAYKDYLEADGKTQIMLYTSGLTTRSASNYVSNYTLAVEFYPQTGSATIDVWGGQRCYFTNFVSTADHTWTNGDDDMCVSDEATIPNIISIGAYVTDNQTTNYAGNVYNFPEYTVGDIAYFSSYATANESPTGLRYPWITAPGARLVSAINHYHTASVDNYSYYGNYFNSDLVVNSSSNPYAAMEGTSMATPTAAGIVALWLQASLDENAQHKNLTVNDVKQIMMETAINDAYTTTGANASHFGNGKINALAGIQYILGQDSPTLSVDPTEVNIEDGTGDARSANVTVTSENLTDALTTTASNHWSATLNQAGTEMTVTYNGKALHQVGSASVHSNADDLHASVSADYLYTGPIYILGNTSSWTANNGMQMTRDAESGIYTATLTAQNSGDGYAYVGFTKRLGSNSSDWNNIEYYRFGPVSNDQNWALYNQWADNRDVYCQLDTVGGYSTIQVPVGTWIITIDSKNNQFKFKELVISSSVSPNEGTLNFGTVFTGSSTTQTITITNDGDLPFTPSLGGPSGAFSTDYVPSELAPGESVTITITYAPETIGSDSETFTVSDGVTTYTWTLTGTAETPVTHGYVEPNDVNVDFGEKALGETYTYSVRIYNDGDLSFNPDINASGLDGVFAVTPTTGITIAPGEYYDLSVSFTPTEEGSYNGTFIVTINGEPTTVTVTGSGSATAIPDDIIHSNSVTVPVYKTDLDVYGPYTYGQVIGDTNRELAGNVTNGLVKVQAKNIDAITDYRLFHNAGAQNNTTNMENWASGNNQSSVAYAVHSIANDNFTTYAKNGNAWAQDAVYTFQNGVEEMWIDLHDNVTVDGNVDTWYVPVIVASSKLGNENTYGSRMEQNPELTGDVMVSVGYDDSSEHREYIDPVTGMEYVYVTAQANITALIPTIEINGHSYEAVMARAWRYYKPYIVGQGLSNDYVLELIGENTEISGATGTLSCSIGSDSWTETNSNDGYLFNEYTFCVKEGEQTDVIILARLYYKRNDVVNPASGMLRLSGGDGGYFAMDGEGDMPEEPTSINEYYSNKELVDITFVNPQGMTSSRPFEGVNIVVKRYSDGSTSTSKVLNR